MKLRNLFYAAFAMTMVACSQEESFLSQNENGILKSISSGSDKFSSRSVVDSKWENGDAIGVFMLKSDASSTLASNIKFTNNTAEASNKVTFTSETGITLVNDKVKFHAYYPWSDTNVTGTTYNVQISDQPQLTDVSGYDLRWAESNEIDLTGGTSSFGGLSLNFAHKLTFLKVKTNVADVKSVSVSGVNTEAQFNIVDGALSGETGNTKSIQLCKTTIDEETVYCGIVVPTTDLSSLVLKIVATEKGKDMVYQYVYGDNTTLAEGFKGGWQYLFNITLEGSTGSATLDKIEAELGGFEGESSVNGEVSDPQEAVTDITVPAGTDLNALKALLADKSGKVSLNFADGTYDLSGGSEGQVGSTVIEIPEAITGISFVGSNYKDVQLQIAKIKWVQDLQELRFENVDVEGNPGDYFMNDGVDEGEGKRTPRFAEDGIVEFKGCYVHGSDRLFYWKGNVVTKNSLASFTIDNCIMVGDGNQLFEGYETKKMIYKNSTFLNWSCLGKITQKTTPVEFDIQNCTFANLKATGFEGGNNSTVRFNSNIVVDMTTDTNRYILYNLTVTEASGNIMDNQDKVGSLTVGTNVEIKSLSEIFINNYTNGTTTFGEDMFDTKLGITAGDTRWLNASTGE